MDKLLFILLSFSLFTCKNETPIVPTVDVKLRVIGTFNGLPLQMYNQNYEYTEGVKIKFQLFNFYLSDLYLTKGIGTEEEKVLLSEVVLINFKDIQSLSAAERGVELVFKNIPILQNIIS